MLKTKEVKAGVVRQSNKAEQPEKLLLAVGSYVRSPWQREEQPA